MRCKGYGNAIVPQVAQAFIEAYMSVVTEGGQEFDVVWPLDWA